MENSERNRELAQRLIDKYANQDKPANNNLEELRSLVADEENRNRLRELANIGSSVAEQATGLQRGNRLSIDDAAKQKLMQALAGGASGGLSDKDLFYGSKNLVDMDRKADQFNKTAEQRDAQIDLARKRLGQAEEKMRRPSEKIVSEFAVMDNLESELDDALTSLESLEGRGDLVVPETGLVRNIVEGAKGFGEEVGLTEVDPQLAAFDAMRAGFSAEKLREKFGSQVTQSEMDKVKPYIPLPNDTPSVVKSKIKNLKREIKKIREARAQALEKTGRKAPTGNRKEEAAPKVFAPKTEADLDSMTDEELEAYLGGQ